MNGDDTRFESRAPKAEYPRPARGNGATPPAEARSRELAAADPELPVALLAQVEASTAVTAPQPVIDPAAIPLRAAEGDDDVMSQAPEATPAQSAAEAWRARVPSAKLAWSRLSESELLKSGGNHRALAGLVRERYTLSRNDAFRQVKDFLNQA